MTLREAIEQLELGVFTAENRGAQKQADALKLSIEALKRLQVLRSNSRALPRLGLPGETKD